MIVTTPFRAVRLSSRDDPNDIFLGPRVADKQKFVHQADGLPALFAVHKAILFAAMIRVVEHQRGDLEVHAVFPAVLAILGFVPFEAH